MAVKAPDHEDRQNPTRNYVSGAGKSHALTVWVKAVAPDGTVTKLDQNNASDWKARGAGWRVLGPWSEDKPEPVEEEEEEEDEETEDESEEEEETEASKPAEADVALKALNDLRAKAESLGVKVNEQWGKKRLTQEIAAAEFRAKAEAGGQ